jgi:hypothetical protein
MSELGKELFIAALAADCDSEAQIVAELRGVGGGERRDQPFRGTKALMLAMLEDAIRAYLGVSSTDRDRAEIWIYATGCTVFSFVVVCETLGLEPDAVRRALRRFRSAQASPKVIGRSRPNGRTDSKRKRSDP